MGQAQLLQGPTRKGQPYSTQTWTHKPKKLLKLIKSNLRAICDL